MYIIKALVDGKYYTLHNPKVKVLTVGDPYFETGDNINGKAEFTVYPNHPYYSKVKKLTTDIIIYNGKVPEFYGRVLYDDETFNGSKKVFVEGELAFFCDSVQRPKVYHNYSVQAYLKDIIDNHNSQVEERKQFVLGRVTVKDSNDSLYRYSNWEDTRTILSEKLSDRLGGHFVIRHEDGLRILDYLSDDDYYVNSRQSIEFGKNLLDFAKNMDASDLATCIIPLGAKLDQEDQDESLEAIKEQRITIADINGGVDYVTDDNAVAAYGRIYRTVTFDDVTVPENLKRKGEEYLKSVQYEKMVLEVKAVDLSLLDSNMDELSVGSRVRCTSKPNALDSWFPVSKKTIYLTQFSKNTITLGDDTENATYTSSNRQETANMEQVINNLPTKSEILQEALRNAQDLINAQTGNGYAIHVPNEFIVADDPDYENQAKNLWRWGLGGLAHYSEGYDGPIDGIALTMDGKINGGMILANSITAESIDIGYRNSVESTIEESSSIAQANAEKAAKEYADGLQESMLEEIDDVTDLLLDLDEEVTNIVNDGIITEAEKAAISKILQTIQKEKNEADAKYEALYSDPYLTGSPKTNLQSKYNAVYGTASTSKYNDLITKINSVTSSTTAEQINTRMTAYRSSYTAYSQALAEYQLAIEDATNAIANEYAKEQASAAQENAQNYADESVRVAKESIETSITNLENRIALSVESVKQIAERKNYIVGGEQETLSLDDFVLSNAAGNVEVSEYLNMKCIKITFTSTGSISIAQDLGTLESGNYKIYAETAYPSGQAPNYIRYGFSSSNSLSYYSNMTSGEFHPVSHGVTTTKSNKIAQILVYGSAGDVCYITNIRCLRDIQEVLDDLKAELEVEVGSVTASVSEIYENSQHDYCVNGDFSDVSDPFAGWYRPSTTYVTDTDYNGESCAKIENESSTSRYIRQSYVVTRPGKFLVRLKAARDTSSTVAPRLRVSFGGASIYTNSGAITSSWQEFEFEFSVTSTGTKYLYIYNYLSNSEVYVTDIEVLGYISGYAESQFQVLADSIESKVAVGDFASYVTQYYDRVITAFNNSSKYVQITAGEIAIYDGSVTDSKKRSSFDQQGSHFWRDGYKIGWIGTNYYSGNSSLKGLTFDLEYQGAYMSWSNKESESASSYSMKWTYANKTIGSYTAGKLHAGCDIDMHGWTLINPSFEDGGVTQTINYVQVLRMNSDGTVAEWGANGMMRFKNGILVDLTYYS